MKQARQIISLLFALLVVAPVYSFPMVPVFKQLQLDDGLPQMGVASIFQDSTGFMWFGTEGGLARFDGYSVRVYRNEKDNRNSLSNNDIQAISQDKEGYLWLATQNGLNRFDPRSEKFERFFHDPDNTNTLSDSRIQAVYIDKLGSLWIGTKYGLNRYDRQTRLFKRYIEGDIVDRNFIRSIYEDKFGYLWLATRSGILIFDKEKEVFIPLRIDDFGDAQPEVMQIYVDHNDIVWAGTRAGLLQYNIRNQKRQLYNKNNSGLKSNNITGLIMDSTGILWLGTSGGGIQRIDPETDDFSAYTSENSHLPINKLNALYEDRSKTLWFSTTMDGVFYMNHSVPFQLIRNDKLNNNVFSIIEDNHSNLWIGTLGGLVKLTSQLEKTTLYKYFSEEKRTIRNNAVWDVFEDSRHNIWASTDAGVDLYDSRADVFRPVLFDRLLSHDDTFEIAFSMNEHKKDMLFISTDTGLVVWDRPGNRAKKIRATTNSKSAYGDSWFFKSIKDSTGQIWVLGNQGLHQWDWETESITLFEQLKDKSHVRFYDMAEDNKGNLWIVSSAGLIKISASRELVTYFEEKMDRGGIYSLEYDGNDSMWLGTSLGLWQFDILSEAFTVYNVYDGLQGGEFNTPTYKASDGRMYFGGVNGITVFYPGDVKKIKESTPPPVVITKLIVNNELIDINQSGGNSFLSRAITFSKELVFDYGQADFFAFEFSALDFKAQSNNRYAYKLEGLNEDWIYTDASNRRAVYAALSPGDYRFKVMAANADGVWNREGVSLKVTVLPPLWRTPWAYGCYVLLVMLGIFTFIKFRTTHIRRQALQLEREVSLRTNEINKQKKTIETLLERKNIMFANVSHELRTPLTLILGPISRMLQKISDEAIRRDLLTSKRNGQRLLKLVEQLLEFTRLSHAELIKSPQSLTEIVDAFASSMQPLAIEKNLGFEVDNRADIWVETTPDALETILLNLLSNAFKYTPEKGCVRLSVEQLGTGYARLIVEDTGMGIPKDKHIEIFERFSRLPQHARSNLPGTGLGLALVKELAEVNGGSIQLRSEEGKGSAFIIELPCCAPVVREFDHSSEGSRKVSNWVSAEAELLTQPVELFQSSRIEENHLSHQEIILVIDDTADMGLYLKSLLSDQYHLISTLDGETGLEIAHQEMPDLIICDVMMPGIDGFEVLERVRSDVQTSHIPVILLTAKGDKASRLRGLQETADDYITKPFDPQELTLRIKSLFTNRLLLRRRLSKELLTPSIEEKLVSTQGLTTKDQIFLDTYKQIIEAHYQQENFTVDQMCHLLFVSERSLQKKTKSLLGYTPNEYLRIYRMEKAAERIKKKDVLSITQLAQEVGFSSQSYFARCFKAYFGISPKNYLQTYDRRVS